MINPGGVSTLYNTQFTADKASAAEIAAIIMQQYEPVLIDRCVKSRYSLSDKYEQEAISRITKEIAKSEGFSPSYSERLAFVTKAVEEYFLKNDTIVPGGFVDFRLREVYYNVEELVDIGAQKYFDEKELEEFTYLLSVFVSQKKPMEECIHLVWTDDGVQLYNKRGRDVTDKYEKEFYAAALKKGLNEEDLAISAVISAAPEKLVFHNAPPSSPLKETLNRIFDKKCKSCQGCDFCKKG